MEQWENDFTTWWQEHGIKEFGEDKATFKLMHRAWRSMRQHEVSTDEALLVLRAVPGPLGVLAEAGQLFIEKGGDYNAVDGGRDSYFPLGLASYAQMLFVKAQRLVSFARQPRQANFEGPRDTCLDLVSYAAFCADWLARQKKSDA